MGFSVASLDIYVYAVVKVSELYITYMNKGGAMESVLFAVLGVSPSVLTETIWALAQESPALIPDHVVVLTTTVGRERLATELFSGEKPGWQRLTHALAQQGHEVVGKLRFGLAADHVRLFPALSGGHDLTDIASSADNEAAADFIMRELRSFTANPATAVLASIAGGRKTMGALLMSCMSLLGREQDRVLHVLVNPPYDSPLTPPFLFPEKGVKHATRDGKKVKVRPAIELIDVPFVRMCCWYEEAFKSAPPSYKALVRGIQRQAPLAVNAPQITLDADQGTFDVADGGRVNMSATEFAALWLLLKKESDAAEIIVKWKENNPPGMGQDWLTKLAESSRFTDADSAGEELGKCLSAVRGKMNKHPLLAGFVNLLVPKRGALPTFPRGKIRFKGSDPFADICGYP